MNITTPYKSLDLLDFNQDFSFGHPYLYDVIFKFECKIVFMILVDLVREGC